jgi:hypothetical protein
MFDGDNDGYSGMLPWVCVFGGLQRLNLLGMLEMNEKKMKRNVRDKEKSDR